jgi:hypothetical protein
MCTDVMSRKTRQRKHLQCHKGRINNLNLCANKMWPDN